MPEGARLRPIHQSAFHELLSRSTHVSENRVQILISRRRETAASAIEEVLPRIVDFLGADLLIQQAAERVPLADQRLDLLQLLDV